MTDTGAGPIAAAVDEDRGQPGTGPGRVDELVIGAERLEQAILHGVLRLIVDERSGDRVQPAEVFRRQDREAEPSR
jgi:hypothetical protein